MIAVCNSLSMYAADPDSDIDLFVVSAPHRMWLVRIIMTVLFHLLGVRRHGKKVTGRFCLSFFCTTNAMDFGQIAIENDVYLRTWVNYLKPIVDIGDTYEDFLKQNSNWGRNLDVPETSAEEALRYRIIHTEKKPPVSEKVFKAWGWWETLLDGLDSLFKGLFLPKTMREYDSLGKPWGIIINDDMLKFHREDERREVRELA